jgi:hypothetical protein
VKELEYFTAEMYSALPFSLRMDSRDLSLINKIIGQRNAGKIRVAAVWAGTIINIPRFLCSINKWGSLQKIDMIIPAVHGRES